jgi:LPS export ABC transporter protein LptC
LKSALRHINYLIPAAIAAGILFSCQTNDLEEVLIYGDGELYPMRTTIGVTYLYTDSGRVKNQLETGKMEQFQVADSAYSLLSDGFALTFFTSSEEFDGKLTAKNGFIKGDNSVMIARDSVVFVNSIGETLHTEELTWVQDSAKVFTDKFVTIEKADGVIYGKGLISDQNFTNYVIKEPSGIIYISEDDK